MAPVWEPPFSEEEVAAFEAEKGIQFPGNYRRFITTAASSGTQPFYGLQSFLKQDSVLVVNSEDQDTYGTVWYFDLANDCGVIPMRDKDTGKPFHFLEWS